VFGRIIGGTIPELFCRAGFIFLSSHYILDDLHGKTFKSRASPSHRKNLHHLTLAIQIFDPLRLAKCGNDLTFVSGW